MSEDRSEKAERIARLEVGQKSCEFSQFVGSEEEKSIDISSLRGETGYVTLDPAFVNTAACTSAITFLDGERGILRYRGFPIEELAENTSFIEVAQLLLEGELPTEPQKKSFEQELKTSDAVEKVIKDLVGASPNSAHPMAILSACLSVLSSVEQDVDGADWSDEANRSAFVARSLAAVRKVAAEYYCKTQKRPCTETKVGGGYCHELLKLMFGVDPQPEVARILEVLFILHADHEQNCSTSTVRVVGSSQAHPYACLAAGAGALWGPLHGGANQAVIEMLEGIAADGGDYRKYLDRAKDKKDSFRLMGFGHRVYKNFDPRARIIKKACDEALKRLGKKGDLFAVAQGLEEAALKDQYFIERKLYPNVDFYSGIIYKALGIPTNMFTVMFALARTPGWLAQWMEMKLDKRTKIARPRQIYTGYPLRKVP